MASRWRQLGSNVRLLQVKTLADLEPSAEYAETRRFYVARGFMPLEVFPELWSPANPALQMVKVLDEATNASPSRSRP